MIQTYFLNFKSIFLLGFIFGMLFLEFIMLYLFNYFVFIKYKKLKDFVIKNKLWQKFEEEKINNKKYNRGWF